MYYQLNKNVSVSYVGIGFFLMLVICAVFASYIAGILKACYLLGHFGMDSVPDPLINMKKILLAKDTFGLKCYGIGQRGLTV